MNSSTRRACSTRGRGRRRARRGSGHPPRWPSISRSSTNTTASWRWALRDAARRFFLRPLIRRIVMDSTLKAGGFTRKGARRDIPAFRDTGAGVGDIARLQTAVSGFESDLRSRHPETRATLFCRSSAPWDRRITLRCRRSTRGITAVSYRPPDRHQLSGISTYDRSSCAIDGRRAASSSGRDRRAGSRSRALTPVAPAAPRPYA